jgi:hypothetical protein
VCFHETPEDLKAGPLRQRSQRLDGKVCIHLSRHTDRLRRPSDSDRLRALPVFRRANSTAQSVHRSLVILYMPAPGPTAENALRLSNYILAEV